MSLYLQALWLIDACAAEGISLVADADGGVDARPEPSSPLCARMAGFLGPDEPGAITAPRRALAAVLGARGRAAREWLCLRATQCMLPVAYTAQLRRIGPPGRPSAAALVTTSRAVYEREAGGRTAAFVATELITAARALDLGRAGPRDVDRWIAAKRSPRPWMLTPELAGLPPLPKGVTPPPVALTVGEVLDGLGLGLDDVEIHAPAREVAA